jgi:2-(3-amino-3-carboxypropyl)histidine synthase
MYALELDRAVDEIKRHNAKMVLIQLPDGLKPQSKEIADALTAQCDATILIWGGSCFGSCDIPLETQALGVDLILHWGHNLQ